MKRRRLEIIETSFNGTAVIKKLTDVLDMLKIPYKLSRVFIDGDKVEFPWTSADVVCHWGSYGHESDQYEVMGRDLQTAEENSFGTVTGYLDLQEVTKRIMNAYSQTHDDIKDERKKSVREYFKARKIVDRV